jgi:hypothetical protein
MDSTLLKTDSGENPSGSTAAVSKSANYDDDSTGLRKLKARFADVSVPFEGVWVNENYINEIRQGKSLRKSADTQTRCIVIPGRTLQVTRWIFGFHDGGAGLVVAKNGSGYFTYWLYNGLLGDTVKILAEDKLKIGRDFYTLVGQKDTTSSDLGVLEKLLFAGRYERLDTPGTAVFEKNGKVEGLDSLGWYDPVIDYADFLTNVDHIRLGRDKHHLKDYGLRFVGDTMMIYSIDCLRYTDGDCVLDTLGHQMYVLQKLNKGRSIN